MNPFLIAGYESPDYFCDRVDETRELIDALENGRNVTMLAPRRMGKTGLIKNAFHHLRNAGDWTTIYVDIYSAQNLAEFTHRLTAAIVGSLDTSVEKALSAASRFFRSFRPVVSIDPMTGSSSYSFSLQAAGYEQTLKECFDYLAKTEKRVVIAIDEFQQIAAFPEKGTEALLRSYIQFIPRVRFIFAGSKRHMMAEMFSEPNRPFYNSTQTFPLGTIDASAYYEFAARHFAAIGITLPREIFDEIYKRFDGVTWYVQVILNRLYGYRSVEFSDIDRAIKALVAENSYNFENLLESYPPGCIRLMKAIAAEGAVKEINAGEFIMRHQLKATSSVNKSLAKLRDTNLVDKTEKGYIIDDRLLGIYLTRSEGSKLIDRVD